jgi:putative ABC transport system permease protein
MSESRVAFHLLRICTLRHWRTSWGSYLLLLAIVAVGVGAFNGIRQASRAASANFGLFNEAVSGRSDFIIEAGAGNKLGERDLFELTALSGSPDWHLLPVIEGSIARVDAAGEAVQQLRIVGLDLIGLGNLPNFIEQGLSFAENQDDSSEWYDWVGPGRGVWMTYAAAAKSGLGVGDPLDYTTGGMRAQVYVAGILGDAEAVLPDDLLVGDIPVVQSLLARAGQLDRVEVVLSDRKRSGNSEYVDAIEQRIRAQLPPSFALSPSQERAESRASMTEAFRLNLTILSLIAILVGAYLILQALDAAVVRRRGEMATLRSLGVGAGTLFAVSLGEAGLIGLVGSVAGVGVGYLLASGAVHLLTDTVNTLYFATSVEAIALTPFDWFLGIALGFIFSLIAGLLPARDAMLTPPAQVLSRGDWSPGFVWLRRPSVGLVLLVLGSLCLLIPAPVMSGGSKMAIGGFLAAAFWIFGFALLSGQALVYMASFVRRFAKSPIALIAISRLADGSSRHRLAVAGLVVAVGMVTGMLQMVGSFRGTIVEWFDVRFQAELYVSERGVSGAGNLNGIAPDVVERLEATPELLYADTVYVQTVDAPVGRTQLFGVDFPKWRDEIKQIWLAEPGTFTAIEGSQPALVSETFARRFDVLKGGVIELGTAVGARTVSPIGIFADYGNEFGSVVVDEATWRNWTLKDRPINSSLYLKPEADPNVVRDRLRLEFPGLDVRNAQELRALALGIFEQTFQVTTALNGIGLTVAMIGLLLGLFAIFEESIRSWQTLGYLGFPKRSLVLTAGVEGAGIAAAAWISGTVLGLVLGWLLIAVINVQSFGWSLIWQVPVGSILGFGAVLIAAGFACGLIAGSWWFSKHTT